MVIYLLNFCFYMLQTPLALPGWRSRLAFAGADTGPSCQSRNQAPPFAYRLPFLALPRSSAPSPLRGFIRCGPAGPSLIGGPKVAATRRIAFFPSAPTCFCSYGSTSSHASASWTHAGTLLPSSGGWSWIVAAVCTLPLVYPFTCLNICS